MTITMAKDGNTRANAAGIWALALGSASFLFQGRQLIEGLHYNWNDMALVSAILAMVYGFIISVGGRTRTLGVAGGALGAVTLFDKMLFYEFKSILNDFNDSLPSMLSAEALFTFGLIIASIYFVIIKPMRS